MSLPSPTAADPAQAASVGADQAYAARLRSGRFEIQRCAGCAAAFFYPRVLCPKCGSTAVEWFAPTGHGVVYSTTTVRRKQEQGGDYNVSIVELAEGPRLMSRVEGVAPGSVHIGMAVAASVTMAGEQPVVVFLPRDGSARR